MRKLILTFLTFLTLQAQDTELLIVEPVNSRPGKIVFQSTGATPTSPTGDSVMIYNKDRILYCKDSASLDCFNIVATTKTYANLGTPVNGTLYYCSNCQQTSPCAAGGTGAIARRENSVWNCSGGGGGGGLVDPGGNGILSRTALNTTVNRTITGTNMEITVTNGDGVSGNPTIAISDTVDLSAKTSTKPLKSGTAAPGTCSVGEMFFDTDATAGRNLLACTATNTWTTINGIAGGITTYGTYASLPATCSSGDQYYTSDTLYTFVCTATNTWTPFADGKRMYLPPTSWNAVNMGSGLFNTTYGYAYLQAPISGSDNVRMQVRNVTAPYKVTMYIKTRLDWNSFAMCGFVMRNSSSGALITYGYNSTDRIYSYYHASPTSSGSGRGDEYVIIGLYGGFWFQVEDDNTNRILRFSLDGNHWEEYSSSTRTTDITADQVGLACNSFNGEALDMMAISYREE